MFYQQEIHDCITCISFDRFEIDINLSSGNNYYHLQLYDKLSAEKQYSHSIIQMYLCVHTIDR